MSSGVVLSAATRQSLLAAQDTASLMATTQTRLATGKKVTSALDNPLNYFTAASLDARSSDISSLLDSIANGVQTIQAANQGISSIQKLLDTAKSTAQQALADKSGSTGSVSGGKTSQAASVSGLASFSGLAGAGGTMDFSALNKDGSIDVSLDGGATTTTIKLDSSTLAASTGDLTKVSADQIVSAINGQIAGASSLNGKLVASTTADGRITLTTTGTGGAARLAVNGSANSNIDIGFGRGTGATAKTLTAAADIDTANIGTMFANGKTSTFTVSDGAKTVNVSLDSSSVTDDLGGTIGTSGTTEDKIKDAINRQLKAAGSSLTASFDSDSLVFTTQDVGPDSQVSISGVGGNAGGAVGLGFNAFTSATPTLVSGLTAGTVKGSATFGAGSLPATTDLSGGKSFSISLTLTGTSAGSKTITIDSTSEKSPGVALGNSASKADLLAAINAKLAAATPLGVTAKEGTTPGTLSFEYTSTGATGNDVSATVLSNSTAIPLGTSSTTIPTIAGGAGTKGATLTSVGTDATDGSSKATLTSTGTLAAAATTDLTGVKSGSFTLQLGSGPAKTIKLDATTPGTGATTSRAVVLKAINDQIAADTGLAGKVTASYVNDHLTFASTTSGSDQTITVKAAQTGTAVDIGLGTDTSKTFTAQGTDVGGSKNGISSVRASLAAQFNNLLDQITQQAKDSSYNGVNLLYRAGNDAKQNTLHLSFNEKGTSGLDIQGVKFDADGLGLSAATGSFGSDDEINDSLASLTTATQQLRNQASTFGSNLTVVQNRQDFSKNLINILDTGSSNLTNADLNEEAANSQALSTRQSLAISALSLANTAQQSVLQLLR